MVDLTSVVRPGDGVLWGQACAEPQTLVEQFVGQREAFAGARVFMGSSFSGIVKPEHADHLRLSSYCGTGTNRALADAGVLEILPAPYSQLGALIRNRRLPCDVVLLQVSPPNARGEYSLGLGVEYLAPALRVARAYVGSTFTTAAELSARVLERIRQSQVHLLGLINEVLSYARLETGSVHYHHAEVAVHDVFASAGALVEPQAQAKEIELTVHPPPPGLSAPALHPAAAPVLPSA